MITEERNIVFSNELTRIEREDLTKDNDEGLQATKEALRYFTDKSSKLGQPLKTLLRTMPNLVKMAQSNPEGLIANKIWNDLPINLARMLASPRYFVGRQVLAKLPVKSNI
jgi:hypothetical protein